MINRPGSRTLTVKSLTVNGLTAFPLSSPSDLLQLFKLYMDWRQRELVGRLVAPPRTRDSQLLSPSNLFQASSPPTPYNHDDECHP